MEKETIEGIIGANISVLILLYISIMLREILQSIIVGVIWRWFTHLEEDDVVYIHCGKRKCRIQKLGIVNVSMFTYDTKAKLIMSYKALEELGIEKKLPNGNGGS
ncbi:MAG: hypothetical protein Tp1124DCM412261_43 [Prokaryotic dsDNA virus sp.]|nr:MAG: hypothetical protein Tp1123DCM939791_35 [Prokaryotic dsDNA virus sp.]QDP59875.1 MAG: hypothetical protein Tp1124DCM412261_43 [Prokaryotic dsDNA virus sp.]|tara:strand:- start:3759 stop:4073 length:315 start_codon:yes stop_codon:yes gene_type:complete